MFSGLVTTAIWLVAHGGASRVPQAPPSPQVLEPTIVEQDPSRWPSDYELVWDAPSNCPSVEELEAIVLRLLPGPTFGQGGRAELRASVRAIDTGYRLSFAGTFDGTTETYEVEEHDCGVLAESVALIVAAVMSPFADPWDRASDGEVAERPVEAPLLAETDSLEPQQESSRAELQPRTNTGESEPSQRPVQHDREPRSRATGSPMAELTLSAGIEAGAFGAVMPSLRGSVGPRWTWFGIEAVGLLVLPRPIADDGFEGLFWLWSASARTCGHPPARTVQFPICLGLEVGQLFGRRDASRDEHLWLAPLATFGVSWEKRGFGVRVDAELGVRLIGANFLVNGESFVTSWPVSARGFVGFFTRLPRIRGAHDNG